MPEIDASNGDEGLSIDQATAAYVKATASKAVQTDQAAPAEADHGDDTTDEELQASDEDVSEETDGETEAEDQAEGDEEEPGSEQGRFVGDNAKVRLADGTVTTIADLKQGSLRQADYTRKTQETSELRKQAESQSTAFKQREQQLAQQAEYVTGLIQAIIPKEPDAALLDTDPLAYMKAKSDFEQWGKHLTYLQQQQQQSSQTKQAEAQKAAKDKAAAEWNALTEKVPDLKDQTKANAFGQKLLAHAKAYGFSEEETRSILPQDHRFALMARDAIKWRELQASKPKVQQKVEGRPPVQKGGKRSSPSESRARQASEALTQLRKTGSVEDATRAYLASRKG